MKHGEINTVTISLDKYLSLRDFKQNMEENHVCRVWINGNYDYITTDESLKSAINEYSKEIDDVKLKLKLARLKIDELEDQLQKTKKSFLKRLFL